MFVSFDPLGLEAGGDLYFDGMSPYRAYFAPNGRDPHGLFQVSVQMDAFIPQQWVPVDPWSDLAGDGRGVSKTPLGPESSRAYTKVVLETEKCVQNDPLISETSTISDSHMRIFRISAGKYRYITKRGTFTSTVTATRTGKCSVRVNLKMHATVPWKAFLLPPSPAIDWDVTFNVSVAQVVENEIAVRSTLLGRHDGFPGYEAYVQQNLIYSHDPIAEGQTPLSLFPPMEIRASGNKLFYEPGTLSCCDCKSEDLY